MSNKQDNQFNIAAEAYVQKFGYIPYGIGYPEITTELLIQAVQSGKKIRAFRLPKGAVS